MMMSTRGLVCRRSLFQLSTKRFYTTSGPTPVENKTLASLALVGAAFVAPSKSIDLAIGVVFPLHCHIGFGSIITDYLPKRKYPLLYPVTKALILAGTAGTIYGLYQYNTKDVGVSEGFASLWKANRKPVEL